MENLLSTTITVESIEDKGKSIKLKCSDRKSYSFWKTKQDGQNTSMFEQFTNMAIQAGMTVNISYKVEEFTTQDGKQAHANKVIWFREAGGTPLVEKPVYEAKNAPTGQSSERSDQFGFRLAIHGMVNGLLASGVSPRDTIELLPDLWLLEKAIEEKLSKPAEMTIAEAKIEQSKKELEEIVVDNIPF